MLISAAGGEPSPARLLVAGQQPDDDLWIQVAPIYGRSHAADIPGKGRGMVASADVAAGECIVLDPALASADSYEQLAVELLELIESPKPPAGGKPPVERDDVLLDQLLSLCVWGAPPTSVPDIASSSEAGRDFLCRRPAARDSELYAAAIRLLSCGGEILEGAALRARLLSRLELACRCNAFRGPTDPLGAVAWHALSPREHLALAGLQPDKVPKPRVWLFLRAALINHSESPNACWMLAGGILTVRACEDIKAGTEVLISYWPDIDSFDALELGLLRAFGLDRDTVAGAPELQLGTEQIVALKRLKAAPLLAAKALDGAAAAAAAERQKWATASLDKRKEEGRGEGGGLCSGGGAAAEALERRSAAPVGMAAARLAAKEQEKERERERERACQEGIEEKIDAAFSSAASLLQSRIMEAERVLPKTLRAFLEPRVMQGQISLHQAAVLISRNSMEHGKQLHRLGIVRIKAALKSYTCPWGKRVLLRLIYTLKAMLRPAPMALLRDAAARMLPSRNETGDASDDFFIQLAMQAGAPADELHAEVEMCVRTTFGDGALVPAVLSKAGVIIPE